MEFPFEGQSKGREAEKAPFFVLVLLLFRWGVFHALLFPFSLAIRRAIRGLQKRRKEEEDNDLSKSDAMTPFFSLVIDHFYPIYQQ